MFWEGERVLVVHCLCSTVNPFHPYTESIISHWPPCNLWVCVPYSFSSVPYTIPLPSQGWPTHSHMAFNSLKVRCTYTLSVHFSHIPCIQGLFYHTTSHYPSSHYPRFHRASYAELYRKTPFTQSCPRAKLSEGKWAKRLACLIEPQIWPHSEVTLRYWGL